MTGKNFLQVPDASRQSDDRPGRAVTVVTVTRSLSDPAVTVTIELRLESLLAATGLSDRHGDS
jgi:hypothetical protein